MRLLKQNDGYTTLEVLVAFSVMLIVLATMLPGQSQLFVDRNKARLELLATDLAHSHLATFGVTEPPRAGTQTMVFENWTIVKHVEVVHTPVINGDTFKVSIEVTGPDGAQLALVHSTMLVP